MGQTSVVPLGIAFLMAPLAVQAESNPNIWLFEWQDQKSCERLFEDTQIRITRCIVPPGTVHFRHFHSGYFSYVLNGGKGLLAEATGTRLVDIQPDTFVDGQSNTYYGITNTSQQTLRYLLIEKKYDLTPVLQQEAGDLR